MRALIRYHQYNCHPETCNHRSHNPWWLERKGEETVRFASKSGAENHCINNNIPYDVKELTWNDVS